MTCAECKFFSPVEVTVYCSHGLATDEIKTHGNYVVNDKGECRVYPLKENNTYGCRTFPFVFKADWCGMFIEKEKVK